MKFLEWLMSCISTYVCYSSDLILSFCMFKHMFMFICWFNLIAFAKQYKVLLIDICLHAILSLLLILINFIIIWLFSFIFLLPYLLSCKIYYTNEKLSWRFNHTSALTQEYDARVNKLNKNRRNVNPNFFLKCNMNELQHIC